MKEFQRTVCVLLLICVKALCVPQQKWRESEDGSKFYIETSPKYNWFEAWSDCARKNMSLVAIDSYDKYRQIDNLLRKLYNTCPEFWIGGHDNAVHLRFEWVSTGETFTFTNWGPNQPADTTKNQHCILMWTDFQWHDYPCTNKIGYICEENQTVKNICNDTTSPIVWIGGNNHAIQSRYEWVSTEQAFTFTNWAPYQPADTIRNEHCILIFSDFQWHDGECYTHKNGFICEENQAIKYACGTGKDNLARTSNE